MCTSRGYSLPSECYCHLPAIMSARNVLPAPSNTIAIKYSNYRNHPIRATALGLGPSWRYAGLAIPNLFPAPGTQQTMPTVRFAANHQPGA